jgi:hypothetical protein
VELKGRQYIRAWNEITGDNAIMSSEVKKWIYNIQNSISVDEFKARVEKFAVIRDLIVNRRKEKCFYFQIWNWTLENFLENINKFYGKDSLIISRIANKTELNQALSILKVQTTQQQPVETKQEMTEEQKQEARKQIEKMKTLLHKTA